MTQWIGAHRIRPAGGRTWADVLPVNTTDPIVRELYAMLENGLLEAWMDNLGEVHLLPIECPPVQLPRRRKEVL